jgi:hypothetical protein
MFISQRQQAVVDQILAYQKIHHYLQMMFATVAYLLVLLVQAG